MLKNYLKTALRFLQKNKLFAAINVFGLSLALAVSFLMLLYVINELSYNTCHKNRKDVYRLVTHLEEFKMIMAGTPYVLASALEDEYPQLESAVNMRNLRGFKVKIGDHFMPVFGAVGTSSEIFDIFTLPLSGLQQADELLTDMNSIVISEDLGSKLFQGENPLGKTVDAIINNEEHTLVVTAVFDNIPENSSLRAECFVNGRWTIDPINKSFNSDDAETGWDYDFWNTWIKLKPGSDPDLLEDQLKVFEEKNLKSDFKKHFQLQNLSDYYLGSEVIHNTRVTGSSKNIKMFISIAFLIVLIATLNYIILATAVSTGRAKEIGLRKTAGASNRVIRRQILSEAVMLALLVLPLALVMMRLGIVKAGELFQTDLQIIQSNLIVYIPIYILLAIIIGISSGLYTSSYLSRLKVLDILENKVVSGRSKQHLRSALIVFQLLIFTSFVSSTLLIRSQYNFALTMDPGYQNKNIVLVHLGRDFKDYAPYMNEIKSNAHVISAAGSMNNLPARGSASMMVPHHQDKEKKVKVEGFSVDFGYLETMGIKKLAGRYFNRDFGEDVEGSYMLNQTAVEQLGIEDPIGQVIAGGSIIGVLEDFNLHSIHSEIPPLIVSITNRYIQELAVKYESGNLENVLAVLEKEWEKVSSDRPFSYTLIEELTEYIYAEEKNLGTIISIAALFALLIACFGLFGLTLFVAKSRTKEIGIKKVLGSSERDIVISFIRRNLFLVLLSSLLAIPVTWYFISNWLNNFAYRITIQWHAFIIAFVIAAIVVVLTVMFHSFRASRANPVDAIKHQ